MLGTTVWIFKKFLGLVWMVSLIIQIALIAAYFKFYKQGAQGGEVPVPMSIAKAVNTAVDKVPAALPTGKVELVPTLVIPLRNDREGLVTTSLRDRLAAEGKYRPKELGVVDQLFKKIGLEPDAVTSADDALKLARSAKVEAVIFGEVEELKTSGEGGPKVRFRLHLHDVITGKELYKGNFSSEKPATNEAGENGDDGEIPLPKKKTKSSDGSENPSITSVPVLSGYSGFLLAWPLLFSPLMLKILDRENNLLTAIVLTAIVAVPLTIGWFSLFRHGTGTANIVLFLITALLAAAWSLFVLNTLVGKMKSA